MYLFSRADDLRQHLLAARDAGRTVGFVPTMGALHEGHLSLIQHARALAGLTVCSIFVNPTQFNQADDLAKYPRTPDKDVAWLAKVGCDVVFLPSEAEIYPAGQQEGLGRLALGRLGEVLEGQFRPGHFDGVAQVVGRLLDIVPTDHLVMGQKDLQQTAVVRALLAQGGWPTQLVVAPTVREADGLAMSSRNARLTPDMRRRAPLLYEVLCEVRDLAGAWPPHTLCQKATQRLTDAGFRVEYLDIVRPDTFEAVTDWGNVAQAVACVAAWAGEVRLIDNLALR